MQFHASALCHLAIQPSQVKRNSYKLDNQLPNLFKVLYALHNCIAQLQQAIALHDCHAQCAVDQEA